MLQRNTLGLEKDFVVDHGFKLVQLMTDVIGLTDAAKFNGNRIVLVINEKGDIHFTKNEFFIIERNRNGTDFADRKFNHGHF